MSAFLTIDQLADRWHLSRFQVYELTRLDRVPLVQMPGQRRILIPLDELERYEAGATDLEVIETRQTFHDGSRLHVKRGRRVRPKDPA